MRDYLNARYAGRHAPSHIWLGVSVEDGTKKSRVGHLAASNASVRFLSIEPLIGAVGRLDLAGIHWVIVGGESGPGARPIKEEWVLDILHQCRAADVPFFFKQWGGRTSKAKGRLLRGEIHSGWPYLAKAAQLSA